MGYLFLQFSGTKINLDSCLNLQDLLQIFERLAGNISCNMKL